MDLENDQQLANTRQKLARLEDRYRAIDDRPITNPEVRRLTKKSFKNLINQLTEEIVRYTARQGNVARQLANDQTQPS